MLIQQVTSARGQRVKLFNLLTARMADLGLTGILRVKMMPIQHMAHPGGQGVKVDIILQEEMTFRRREEQ